MEKCDEILINWLNNAYSMETSMIETLERHAEDAKNNPKVEKEIRDHIEQTKSQAERVRSCIERLGGEVSGVKPAIAKVMGALAGITTDLAKDQIVKNAIADHASEHLEMASYLAIIEAARYCDDQETAQVCKEILQEEEEMARKTKASMPEIVREYIEMAE